MGDQSCGRKGEYLNMDLNCLIRNRRQSRTSLGGDNNFCHYDNLRMQSLNHVNQF